MEAKLFDLGWPSNCCDMFLLHWTPSTHSQYNDYIKHFQSYCLKHNHSFPHVSENVVAMYLYSLADSSCRPCSKVYGTLSALGAFLKL